MSSSGKSEFWRDIKPIQKVFQPDAKPEIYLANVANDDDRQSHYGFRLLATCGAISCWQRARGL